MGLFGMFTYKNSNGDTYWLHKDEKGNRTIYYFSKDPVGALPSKPKGYKVAENPHSNMPYLKRGRGGMIGKLMDLLGMDTDYHPDEE